MLRLFFGNTEWIDNDELLGKMDAIAMKKYTAKFSDIMAMPAKEQHMFLNGKFEAATGLQRYTDLLDAHRAFAAAPPPGPGNMTIRYSRATDLLTSRESARGWVKFMENPRIETNLPDVPIQ